MANLADLFEYIPGDNQGEIEHFSLITDQQDIVIYPKTISSNFAVLVADEFGIYHQHGEGHHTLTSAMLTAVSMQQVDQ